MIIGIVIFFFIAMPHITETTGILLLPIGFVLLLFFIFGIQMNYFIIYDGKLIIKNHYFFWRQKIYDLNEIREMVIETPYRNSDSLRVITNEYSSTLFGAGSLRNNNWR
jgi:hypothetical protein